MNKRVNKDDLENKVKHGSKKKTRKSSSRDNTDVRTSLDRGKSQVTSVTEFAGVKSNDPSWYLNNPVLSRDAGSVWFSRPTGIPLYGNDPSMSDPGIMVLRSMLTWGGNTYHNDMEIVNPGTPGDPINMTATKLYQYVVHANSRNVSYDKKDLLMTMMAIDGVWQFIGEAIRSYRLVAQYDLTNKYMSKLLYAAGWDPDNLKSNVAQFRFYINYAITRINKFFVPDLFDMWKLHGSAYTNIYLDEPNSKAQYIIKVPSGYWIYNDIVGDLNYCTEVKLPGAVDPINLRHSVDAPRLTVKNFADIVDYMISTIEDSQYLGIIQGDLLKAFGFEHMAQFNYVDIDVPIYPIYDQEFLYKLHNADLVHIPTSSYVSIAGADDFTAKSCAIYRDTNDVDGNILMYSSSEFNSMRKAINRIFLDIPDGITPSADVTLIMSLYKASKQASTLDKWRRDIGSQITCYVGSPMPEILISGEIYYSPTDMANRNIRLVSSIEEVTNLATAEALINRWTVAQRFNSYPALLGKINNTIKLLWETDNFCEITDTQLENFNTVIMWSLWANSLIASN